MSEPTSKSFLEHAVRNSTQYSEGWRQICQELLDARARIAELEGLKPPPPEEKNKRLAKGSDGKERPWTPHERYMLFAKGFRSGAGVRAIDPACEGIGSYDRGYDEGIEARRKAVARYAEEIGYVPSILRTADPDSPEVNPTPEMCRNCFDYNSGRCIGCRQCNETGKDPNYMKNRISELIVGPTPGKSCPDCLLPLGMGCDCATRKD